MKALSIYQPHASLVADEHKRYETRSWKTSYRGPLLICAAKKKLTWDYRDLLVRKGIPEALWDYFYGDRNFWLEPTQRRGSRTFVPGYKNLPFGKALCIAELTDCYRIDNPEAWDEQEKALGDFRIGRYAWRLDDVSRFVEPWPVVGRQRLFEVPDKLIEMHELEES